MKKLLILLVPVTLLLTGCVSTEPIGPESAGLWNFIIKIFSFLFIFTGKIFGNNIVMGVIISTILFKVLSIPAYTAQIKNSANMAKHAPEIAKIKKKYAGKKDQESKMKMHNETQAVYKKNGINPFAGCLPMLIQMPLLFAFYGAIRNVFGFAAGKTEIVSALPLFGAEDMTRDFLFWSDLGQPVIIIGVLAAASTYYSMVVSSIGQEDQAGAEMMRTMKIVMPIMILFIGFSLPGAFSMYWLIGNVFTIGQTLVLKRDIIRTAREKKKLNKINIKK